MLVPFLALLTDGQRKIHYNHFLRDDTEPHTWNVIRARIPTCMLSQLAHYVFARRIVNRPKGPMIPSEPERTNR